MEKKNFKSNLKASISAMKKIAEDEATNMGLNQNNDGLEAGNNDAEPITTPAGMDGSGAPVATTPEFPSAEEIAKSIEVATEELDDEIEKEKLSESFKSKIQKLIKLKEDANRVELETEYAEKQKAFEDDLIDKEDAYLEEVVDGWLEDNKVAVTESIRTRIFEGFIEEFKGLLQKYNVNLPEEEVAKSTEYAAECDDLRDELNDKVIESIQLKKAFRAERKARLIAESMSKLGLADSEAGKLKKIMEDVEYTNDDDFVSSLEKEADKLSEEDDEGTPPAVPTAGTPATEDDDMDDDDSLDPIAEAIARAKGLK